MCSYRSRLDGRANGRIYEENNYWYTGQTEVVYRYRTRTNVDLTATCVVTVERHIDIDHPDFLLPSGTKTIDSEAFFEVAAKVVKLPESVTAIGTLAFANCPNLVAVYIPEDCTAIATNAFSGCVNLTIYGHEGSYAEFYAGKQGFAFKTVD